MRREDVMQVGIVGCQILMQGDDFGSCCESFVFLFEADPLLKRCESGIACRMGLDESG